MTSKLAKKSAKLEAEHLKKQIGFCKTTILNLVKDRCDEATMLREIYAEFDRLNKDVDVTIQAIDLIPKWDD